MVVLMSFSMNVSALYPYGQCTWAAWNKAYEMTGIQLLAWGNAKYWYQNAKNAGYTCIDYYSGVVPPANSIAVWSDSGAGHIICKRLWS